MNREFRQPHYLRIILLVIATFTAWMAQAQDPCNNSGAPLQLRYNRVDASGFPKIVSYVTVSNDSGQVIGSLDSSHFLVEEDGFREDPIEVVDLTQNDEGVTVVVVMDRSTSMKNSDLMDGAIDAAAAFVGLLGEKDQAGLVSFGSDVRVDQEITIDKQAVIQAIRDLKSKGGTRLYDGVMRAAQLLDAHTANPRKALVVLSDGDNKEDSNIAFDRMLEAVAAMGFPVYTISLKERGGTIEQNLITLACRTGGQYYYSPKTDDLSEIYRRIADMLRKQYRITYTTHNPARDGSRRMVRITVNTQGSTASDTAAYFAPLDVSTLSPVTDDIPAPNRRFTIRIVIPEQSFPVYELQEITFTLTFDMRYLAVAEPLDQHLLPGALFGDARTTDFSYRVDAQAGRITFTLRQHSGSPPITGKGEVVRVVFQTVTDLPDAIPLHFRLLDASARNRDGNAIQLELTELTVRTFGAITMAITTPDILQPGRSFRIVVGIPAGSKPLPGMRTVSLVVRHNSPHLRLQEPEIDAVARGTLLQPAEESTLRFTVHAGQREVALEAARNQGSAAAQGRGSLLELTFLANADLPDSSAVLFEIIELHGYDDSGWEIPFRIENLQVVSDGLIVWPGDTDANGRVELNDVLPLGVHFTLRGPGRPEEPDPLLWKAQLTRRYPVRMAAHADADGSGKVDERDLIPVALNWGKVANKTPKAGMLLEAASPTPTRAAMASEDSGQLAGHPAGLRGAAPVQPGVQQRLTARVWVELMQVPATGRKTLRVHLNQDNARPIRGLTFKVVWPGRFGDPLAVRAGNIWPTSPLLLAHRDVGAQRLGVAALAPAGSPLPRGAGLVVEIEFRPSGVFDLNTMLLENVALISPEGAVQEVLDGSREADTSHPPEGFILYPAYPNPFNPRTTVQYSIPVPAHVALRIVDTAGRQILVHRFAHQQPGVYHWQWDGRDTGGRLVSSGIYLLHISAVSDDGTTWHRRIKLSLVK